MHLRSKWNDFLPMDTKFFQYENGTLTLLPRVRTQLQVYGLEVPNPKLQEAKKKLPETSIPKTISPTKNTLVERENKQNTEQRSYPKTKARQVFTPGTGYFTCSDIRLKEKGTKLTVYGSSTQKSETQNSSSKCKMEKENQPPKVDENKTVTITEVMKNLEKRRRTISTADFDDASTVVDE